MNIETAQDLTQVEMKALVRFWERYLAARKAFYRDYQKVGHGYGDWQVYKETKEDAHRELVETLPIIKQMDWEFWRIVNEMRPVLLCDAIIRRKREKAAIRDLAY